MGTSAVSDATLIYVFFKGKTVKDSNVEAVITQLKQRENVGYKKYGVNTDRTDLDVLEWLQHLQEELMDGAVYIEKIKKELLK